MFMGKIKIAAIIPAYNEEKTVGEVVRAAKSSDLLDEVIVASDGSKDKTAVRAKSAGAKVFEIKPNRGKGGAMLYAAKKTDADIIIFLDADLKGFSAGHIKRILEPVIRVEMRMCVGLRDRGRFINRLMPYLPLIGGERAIERHLFLRIPQAYLRGFMVEAAMNYYCRSRRLKYGTVPLPGLKIVRKMQKVGFSRGLWQYIKMSQQVVTAMIKVRWGRLIGKF